MQPAVVSLWALHITGREFSLIRRSLQDSWPGNISSAQYFIICVQSIFSHLYYFEEKSSLVLWQESGAEKHWQPQGHVREDSAPANAQPPHRLPRGAPGTGWGSSPSERPGKLREAKSNKWSGWNMMNVMNNCIPIKKYPLIFSPKCSLTGILLPDLSQSLMMVPRKQANKFTCWQIHTSYENIKTLLLKVSKYCLPLSATICVKRSWGGLSSTICHLRDHVIYVKGLPPFMPIDRWHSRVECLKVVARDCWKSLQVNLSHTCTCQNVQTPGGREFVQTDQENVLFFWQINCISLLFLLNSMSMFLKLKNVPYSQT